MYKNKRFLLSAAALLFFLVLPTLNAGATQLNQASVRLSRMTQSFAGADLFVTFKLNTTPTSVAKVSICFPNTKSDGLGSGFTVSAGTPTVTGTDNKSGAIQNSPATTVPPGTLTAASTTTTTGVCPTGAGFPTWAGVITISGLTSASLTNSTLYGVNITGSGLTNPSANAQYNTMVVSSNSTPTVIDSTYTPTYIANATGDQVTVTAAVNPNFSFSLSANADTIPAVDSSTIQTSTGNVYMTVATNSPLGYTAYVKSQNAQLQSTLHSGTPITTGTFDGTPDTVTAGTTKYGFVPSTGTACSTCTGVPVYDAEYAVADGTHAGSFNSTNFASFVTHAGYTNGDQIYLRERDAVNAAVQYANDYSDVLTIVAAGNF